MAVTITSDLVAGVLQAGSPNRISAAMNRLAGADGPSFGKALLAANNATPARGDDLILNAIAAADPAKKQTAELRLAGKAHMGELAALQKFEAVLLSNAFEDVLPDSENGAFGGGFAGGVWRSMAAEQFANLYAQQGGVGIADMLAKHIAGGAFPEAETTPGQWPYFQAADIKAFQT